MSTLEEKVAIVDGAHSAMLMQDQMRIGVRFQRTSQSLELFASQVDLPVHREFMAMNGKERRKA